MSEVLLEPGERQPKKQRTAADPGAMWLMVAWVGLAIALVGWSDLALLWFPLQFGNPEWEFGTISAHLNGMPLAVMGTTLLTAGAISLGWRRVTRALAVVAALTLLSLAIISIIYLLDIPLALRAASPQLKPMLKRAMLKAGLFAIIYSVLHLWLTVYLWKKSRVV